MNRPLKPGMRDREILIKSTLLSQLGMESTAAMMEMAAILSLAPHQVLFRAGEAADSLYCVLIGYVRAYHLEAGGREADVALYGPGEFIGAGAVFDNKGHTVNAQTAEPTVVARFDVRRVRDAAFRQSDLAMALAGTLARQLDHALLTIGNDRLHTAQQRVANYLLSNCPNDGKATSFRLPYQKSLLAGKLGLAPEALSRAFSMLRDHGVHVRGRLVQIDDPEALRRI
jgi:CRP/FNR family transcriptional regulator, dissimilatory nitrate respiration regulator